MGSVMAEGQVGAKIDVNLPKNKVPKISAKMYVVVKAFRDFPFFKSYVGARFSWSKDKSIRRGQYS